MSGVYQVFLREEDCRKENDASTKRAKLRDEMGEELYMQYFPDEQSKAEEEETTASLKEYYRQEKEKKKRKKVDTSNWKF
jgi:hypothetical protein